MNGVKINEITGYPIKRAVFYLKKNTKIGYKGKSAMFKIILLFGHKFGEVPYHRFLEQFLTL